RSSSTRSARSSSSRSCGSYVDDPCERRRSLREPIARLPAETGRARTRVPSRVRGSSASQSRRRVSAHYKLNHSLNERTLLVTDQSQFAFGLMALSRVVEEQLRPPSTRLGCKGQVSAESAPSERIAPKRRPQTTRTWKDRGSGLPAASRVRAARRSGGPLPSPHCSFFRSVSREGRGLA